MDKLTLQLRPRVGFFRERGGLFQLNNLIGTVDIGGQDLIEVSPKIATDDDWPTATVSLLTGREAIDIAGERQAGVSLVHNRLLEGVAAIFLQRLERAFRQEGPIVLLERAARELPYLQGTLNVTSWVRKAFWRPHVFPVSRVELAHDNLFTHGLVRVAQTLANVACEGRAKSGLMALARDLSVGISPTNFDTAAVTSRALPAQWSAYRPAWSLAVAVLTKTSLFGPTGNHTGVGIAVEAWPLLETLLERTLQSAVRLGQAQGRTLVYEMKGKVQLLAPVGTSTQASFSPEPDGRLFEGSDVIATFEAKYSAFDGKVPARHHVYQALSTAAASNSPVAVLVYPGTFETRTWKVLGFNGKPIQLIAIGLSMFNWLPPHQADDRGEKVLTALANVDTDQFLTIRRVRAA